MDLNANIIFTIVQFSIIGDKYDKYVKFRLMLI